MKTEQISFSEQMMLGIHKAVKQLVISSAEKDRTLVIADKDGVVKHVAAKELLKNLSEK
ncbi:MAG TPA: hypothetical protein VIM55_06895 [Mucilaginibacter sp.]